MNFRIIAASNRYLEEEVRAKRFREDLYYRLKVISFILPPLRKRKEDIPLLIEHFNGLFSNNGSQIPIEISERFLSYHWSGNVRELENQVKRLLILGEEEKVGDNASINAHFLETASSLPSRLEEFEKEQIIKALAECNGVKRQAAKLLNIPEGTLREKIRKYDL